ncbi:MAG: DUF3800 domain-containing protein [Deltaproteobacteria bacterium]|nr:DUF3800 domain-containing protein [Deltaproteobacteria bacterium]
MSGLFNIYCDESCHLLNDGQPAMVLGALWCPRSNVAQFNQQIGTIKARHNLSRYFEIKWTKISTGKVDFYSELIDFFFATDNLNFRAWIIPDKSILKHEEHGQSHDDWYYKMYFYLLRNIFRSGNDYHIYLDIKDTRGRKKLRELHDVLRNAHYDFNREMITRMQHVHSHDIGLLQLADLFIGAISYKARNLTASSAKQSIIEEIKSKSGLSLERNTLPSEMKFNLCFWRPNEGGL